MEDDVLLTENSSSYIFELFKLFCKENNKLLYLQSVSPSFPTTKKNYNSTNLEKYDYYYKVSKKHNDFAGTCCYMVTPSSAKILVDFTNTFGAICIDGFIHNCHKYTELDICIPLEFKNTAELHPEYC
jgi:GR25 family glycosyltransferase involved in LPS biosynthesis